MLQVGYSQNVYSVPLWQKCYDIPCHKYKLNYTHSQNMSVSCIWVCISSLFLFKFRSPAPLMLTCDIYRIIVQYFFKDFYSDSLAIAIQLSEKPLQMWFKHMWLIRKLVGLHNQINQLLPISKENFADFGYMTLNTIL